MVKIIAFVLTLMMYIVILTITNYVMIFGSILLTGNLDYSHWGFTVITLFINVKILMIVNKHINITTEGVDK